MTSLRIVFMGSAPIAVPTLEYLASQHDLLTVVTQPDRPAGRKRVMTPTAVKAEALRRGLRVLEPRRLKAPAFREALEVLHPEVIVVMAYGRLVPPPVLALPPLGCINIHGSMLPFHRGPCPIERGILSGDAATGITTFYMDEGFDTGDIILAEEVPIAEDDTGGSMREKLSRVAVRVIDRTLFLLAEGKAPRVPQDREAGSHAPVIKRDEARLDWRRTAPEIDRLVRACDPEPGAFTTFRSQALKVRRPLLVKDGGVANGERGVTADPGTILGDARDTGLPHSGLAVSAGAGGLVVLQEVQPAGKRWMSGSEFVVGYRPRPGEQFELPREEPTHETASA